MAKSKRENMVEPGYRNGVVDGVGGDNSFDDVVGLFEAMEGLDEDNVSVDAEDWDAQFQNLGPIPSEVLQGFGHVSAANIGYNTQRVWPDKCVPHHRTYEVKQLPDNDVSDGVEVSSDSSRAKGARLFHTHSPISVLQSSGSYSTEKKIPTAHELLIPVRTRSKRLRPPALCKWHLISPIVPSKKILNTKRKEGNRKKLPPLLPEELEVNENQKRCTHCQATQTPLWRKGPMGIGTLCNACGVKYRCQGVLPAYRFRPWPTAGKEKNKLPQLPKDPEVMGNHQHLHKKRCTYCQVTESLEWRDRPMGSGTLCKACGEQYRWVHFPENRHSPLVEKKIKKRPRLPEDLAVKKTDPHMQSKRCTHCQVTESPEWRDGPMGSGTLCNACGVQYQSGHLPESCPSPTIEKIKKPPQLPEDLAVKKIDLHMQSKRCTLCQVTESPEWKDGPLGSGALCNACGVQYQSGNLLPKCRPSPTVEKKRKKSLRLPEDLDVKENHWHLHNKRCTLCNGCEVQYQLSDFLPECRHSPTLDKTRKKRPRLTEYLVVTENHQHRHDKRCTHCQVMETQEWRDRPMGLETLCNTCGDQYHLGHLLPDYHPSPIDKRKKSQLPEGLGVKESNQRMKSRKCTHCQATQTPQWREGPMGPKTLCNACGVRYRKGRLLPEYRPLASPTFVPSLHSNSHKKVLQMRNELIQKSSLPERKPAVYPQPGPFPMDVMQTRNEVFQESSVPMMNPSLCPPPGPIPIYALQSQMRNEVVQEHFVPEMTLAMSPRTESFPVNAMHMRNEVVLESGLPKMEPATLPLPEFVPMNSSLYNLIQE